MNIWDYTIWIVVLFYLLLVVATVYTVLFERRDPVRAISWITVVVMLPGVGIVLFVFFGQNYRKQKIFNRKEIKDLRQIEILSDKQIGRIDDWQLPEIQCHSAIIKLLLSNSKSLLTIGNSIDILHNGSNTFKAIKQALNDARHSIHLEYYIIEADNLGHEIAEILCRKAREGVEVRLLYDDVGSWSLPRGYLKMLREAGVELAKFMPVVFPWFTSKANYRNHRKVIVIDGRIGFTGGLNIADRYINGTKHGIWRDTHLRIEGPAVRMLQMTFVTDWYFSSKILLRERSRYFPELKKSKGTTAVQIALSGPDSPYAAIMQAFFAAITSAKHHIYISTPYFLPGEALLTAIKVASMSGVDVRIMLPLHSDTVLVHWASRSYFTELLEAKVGVYLYKKGFNHSKLLTIDSSFCSIGSANMDERSFVDNFEITAMIYDEKVADELELAFLEDLKSCQKLTLRSWENRKQKDNFKEAAARLFSPLL
ncbi:MAG: cardiolipin synthase [Mucinivorans sp.]